MESAEVVITIICSVIGSGAMFAFIQFLITRKDQRNEMFEQINKRLDKIDNRMLTIEKDNCRQQMMLLMNSYPDEKQKLMKLAEHYFVDLKGDWYFTDLFLSWLRTNNIEKPVWFKGE